MTMQAQAPGKGRAQSVKVGAHFEDGAPVLLPRSFFAWGHWGQNGSYPQRKLCYQLILIKYCAVCLQQCNVMRT
jgi:hypothetical protein